MVLLTIRNDVMKFSEVGVIFKARLKFFVEAIFGSPSESAVPIGIVVGPKFMRSDDIGGVDEVLDVFF